METHRGSGLVRACRGGDRAAWALLVSRHTRYVHAVARRAGHLDEHAVEDVAQEAFLRAFARLDELRDDEAFTAWLARVAERLAIDRARSDRRERPGEQPIEDAGVPDRAQPGGGAMDPVDVIGLRLALGALPLVSREIVDRYFLRDQSYATIAGELRLPPGTVASRLNRARARLRADLEAPGVPVAV